MFSKKIVIILGIIILIAVNITVLSITSNRHPSFGPGQIVISFISPFQEATSRSIRFLRDMWSNYFFLVSVAKENDSLKKALSRAIEKNRMAKEIELSNIRLHNLLNLRKTVTGHTVAAKVIGRGPSFLSEVVIIDRGRADEVEKGAPVITPEGIAGHVIDVSHYYSKVLLIIDKRSAVDALVQRTRDRGIVKGASGQRCIFEYALRGSDVRVKDTVVSSGLDGVFPKGLTVGYVSEVARSNSNIFQEVTVIPSVDFERLEEVLILLNRKSGE